MKYALTAKTAKKLDDYSINVIGIPSVVLMERAALAVMEEAILMLNEVKGEQYKSIDEVIVFASVGNNGADGLAVARMLFEKNINVSVYVIGNMEKCTSEFEMQLQILNNISDDKNKIPVVHINDTRDIKNINLNNKLVIDSIFGIGLARDVSGIFEEIIRKINDECSYIIAVDIPSGLNSTNGAVMGIAVHATKTVTFSYIKAGMWLYMGRDYIGSIIVKDIGFPSKALEKIKRDEELKNEVYEIIGDNDLKLIPKRKATSHKGDYKNVYVIGGNLDMSGAVIMASKAVYKMGAGIVKIFCNEKNLSVVKGHVIEAIVNDYSKIQMITFDEKKDILLIGPGLSVDKKSEEILTALLEYPCKKILDADALNIISKNRILLDKLNEDTIITPHLKEFSRLTGYKIDDINNNSVEYARNFSEKYGCVLVLKSATTIITDKNGNVRINTSGNSGMSKGGSGDVLSGIIAGCISQGMDSFDGASVGVYIHGKAGDYAMKEKGIYSFVAEDMLDNISRVLKEKE